MPISRLNYVITHAETREEQELVLAALRFKCDVLWAQLDGLYGAYVAPGHIPHGAFLHNEPRRSPSRGDDHPNIRPGAAPRRSSAVRQSQERPRPDGA